MNEIEGKDEAGGENNGDDLTSFFNSFKDIQLDVGFSVLGADRDEVDRNFINICKEIGYPTQFCGYVTKEQTRTQNGKKKILEREIIGRRYACCKRDAFSCRHKFRMVYGNTADGGVQGTIFIISKEHNHEKPPTKAEIEEEKQKKVHRKRAWKTKTETVNRIKQKLREVCALCVGGPNEEEVLKQLESVLDSSKILLVNNQKILQMEEESSEIKEPSLPTMRNQRKRKTRTEPPSGEIENLLPIIS